jgi:hypothetical protein
VGSPFGIAWRRYRRNRLAVGWLAFVVAAIAHEEPVPLDLLRPGRLHPVPREIDDDHWQVWGTVTNVSPYVVQIHPSESWVIKFKETGDQVEYHTTSMGLAFYPKGTSGGVHPHARIYKPALPTKIAPGKSWTGTWSGIDDLPAGLGIEVSFGYFVPIARRSPT